MITKGKVSKSIDVNENEVMPLLHGTFIIIYN